MAAPSRLSVRQVELRTMTTLGVGGPAELWEVCGEADLREATLAPYHIIGAGSNLLVADRGVSGRIIKLGPEYQTLERFTGQTDLWLGAATPMPGLVRRSAEVGLSGLEGLLGVPAVLGGAVAMNAGTRFGCMADVVQEVELFTAGGLHRLPASALAMRYRHTELPPGAIITRVRLQLTCSAPERVEATLAQVDSARKGQPKAKSAGCAFKNPQGDSAGRLIDQAGLKGLTVGRAMVSLEHGNFIVNLGGATARDICTLLSLIRQHVPGLELEWRLWGFEEGECAAA